MFNIHQMRTRPPDKKFFQRSKTSGPPRLSIQQEVVKTRYRVMSFREFFVALVNQITMPPEQAAKIYEQILQKLS